MASQAPASSAPVSSARPKAQSAGTGTAETTPMPLPEAPGVVVCYTDDPDISSGRKFAAAGMQIAAGVPLKCDEPDDFRTFRLGLFGLDKLHNVERTVAPLDKALDEIL